MVGVGPRPAIPSCSCHIPGQCQCRVQAACRPAAGRCSSQEWPSHAVANDAVDRHEDEPPGDAARDREAFLGLAAFFVVTAPLPPLAAPYRPELLLSAEASVGGSEPVDAGSSKSREAQEVCLDCAAEPTMDAPSPAAVTSSTPLNSLIQLGQESLAPRPTCDTCLTSVGYPISISCSLCTVNICAMIFRPLNIPFIAVAICEAFKLALLLKTQSVTSSVVETLNQTILSDPSLIVGSLPLIVGSFSESILCSSFLPWNFGTRTPEKEGEWELLDIQKPWFRNGGRGEEEGDDDNIQ